MKKIEVLRRIMDYGILAVITAGSKNDANKMIAAVRKGGIKVIEVAMTVPNAIDIIKEFNKDNKDDIVIGAGTVLDPETAKECISAGAHFIVTPMMDSGIIKLCNRNKVAIIPKALGVSDIIAALEAGADIVKIFPEEELGADVIASVKKVLPQADIIPMGGVTADNVSEWIKAGASAIGVGSELTKGSTKINYTNVEKTAARFVEELEKARA
ncbi:bifunctional 4-hydroxy-2-oxoglutarate aldolase/2-dehydro-3-deoxy-phosphogluconate aldolase [Clostridium oryzae]|uniref:KHG/KDPG aldolase n=1 Tax=Clostridium oryzae TaxID=1450648 RepID=A0A1V4ID08_9CLOT|nr:bifunctional 4-hydroxy-2-oxoglutarate aldolase/2-dehydro-3-deoxy-phosphogluconate aldolase [Clostridium oryzae]OPJ57770.1 KHG/KDPG aldolase [Clostridium oryzae]